MSEIARGSENGYTFVVRQLHDDNEEPNQYFTFLSHEDGDIIEYYTDSAYETLDELYKFIKPHLSNKTLK